MSQIIRYRSCIKSSQRREIIIHFSIPLTFCCITVKWILRISYFLCLSSSLLCGFLSRSTRIINTNTC
nr:MAG TPA: hypothetical protein [Caudoviricetes sp.]